MPFARGQERTTDVLPVTQKILKFIGDSSISHTGQSKSRPCLLTILKPNGCSCEMYSIQLERGEEKKKKDLVRSRFWSQCAEFLTLTTKDQQLRVILYVLLIKRTLACVLIFFFFAKLLDIQYFRKCFQLKLKIA